MGKSLDDKLARELQESYEACTLGARAPVHAILSGDMILDMQPRLAHRVDRGSYYELFRHADGHVSLTKVK